MGVSIVLYIVSRFSPSEWKPIQIKGKLVTTTTPPAIIVDYCFSVVTVVVIWLHHVLNRFVTLQSDTWIHFNLNCKFWCDAMKNKKMQINIFFFSPSIWTLVHTQVMRHWHRLHYHHRHSHKWLWPPQMNSVCWIHFGLCSARSCNKAATYRRIRYLVVLSAASGIFSHWLLCHRTRPILRHCWQSIAWQRQSIPSKTWYHSAMCNMEQLASVQPLNSSRYENEMKIVCLTIVFFFSRVGLIFQPNQMLSSSMLSYAQSFDFSI